MAKTTDSTRSFVRVKRILIPLCKSARGMVLTSHTCQAVAARYRSGASHQRRRDRRSLIGLARNTRMHGQDRLNQVRSARPRNAAFTADAELLYVSAGSGDAFARAFNAILAVDH